MEAVSLFSFHQLSLSEQRFYEQNGYVQAFPVSVMANYGGHRAQWERKETRRDRMIAREEVILQPRIKRNKIAPRKSINFQELLRCIEVVDEVTDDEGTMTTMLTEHVGVVDLETLSTRYVLHFDSLNRDKIEALLRAYLIDKYRCTDAHTIVVPRMMRQNRFKQQL